jgi:hypothetical protein
LAGCLSLAVVLCLFLSNVSKEARVAWPGRDAASPKNCPPHDHVGARGQPAPVPPPLVYIRNFRKKNYVRNPNYF